MIERVVPNVHKIAVLRANGIGDLIFALPALDALRAAYPTAEIVLLGQQWHAEFLAGRPGPVDRVVVVPPSQGVNDAPGGVEDPARLEEFFAAMTEEAFDLAVQLHGGGRYSNPFVRRLGARLTVGLRTPDAVPLDRWVPYVYFQREVLRFLEVVALVGATPVGVEPRLDVTAADLTESQRVVPEDDRPLVALHPGAGDPERRWPAEKFAVVGDALAAAGARVVITGARPGERVIVERVAAAMTAPAQVLWGRLSLGGLAALFSRCTVVVSNDSGPLHLAGAVGAHTVGIYWCFNFINAGPMTQTRHRPAIAWRIHCPVCGIDRSRARCDHHPSFVADVSAAEVSAAALELFEAARGRIAQGGQPARRQATLLRDDGS